MASERKRSAAALRTAIAEDIRKGSTRLKSGVLRAMNKDGVLVTGWFDQARYVLRIRRFHFIGTRGINRVTADELQSILEKNGAGAYFSKKRPRKHQKLTDEEALAYFIRIVRGRNMGDIDALLSQAIKYVNEEVSEQS